MVVRYDGYCIALLATMQVLGLEVLACVFYPDFLGHTRTLKAALFLDLTHLRCLAVSCRVLSCPWELRAGLQSGTSHLHLRS